MTRMFAALAAIALVLASPLVTAPTAHGHERRTVGPYQLVVGFLDEPALAGTLNGVDLTITDTRVTPAKSVEGAEKTLTVEILAGGLSTSFKPTLAARFGQPGRYAAYF